MDNPNPKLKLLLNITEEDVTYLQKKYPHLTAFDIHTEGKKALDWVLEKSAYISDVSEFFSRWLARTEDTKIRRANY